ncbi:F0F1 ATP synthase subunit epsilon [Aquicoccus porphyridii]|uniref:ATP synthase epsilon chain n=1 Tax=Aquicoccus porphyridii TaxID=1852029 RepID=A0A5A9ZCB1_9RHOB|nr:F0F1 ATP synthase subunit epsilon [Aquicoccus porphyridii]KAA0914857.1 F0F1 ATP synthase subunit epsilon [Aquicoccus porphyridii]RAI52644.1 F0F1 ATP synthase subunit epsilon [Rhodobacteraceae bacterium AsT-22]
MAETMQFDLVSPERSLASLKVAEIQMPGADGDLTAMPGHTPLITTLRPGVIRIKGPEGDREFLVTGGFAEISAEATSVLAELAKPVSDATGADLDPMIEAATAAVAEASGAARDRADKQLADLKALREIVAG